MTHIRAKPERPASPFPCEPLSEGEVIALARWIADSQAPWWKSLAKLARRLASKGEPSRQAKTDKAYLLLAGLALTERWGWLALENGALAEDASAPERAIAPKALRVLAQQRKERLKSLNGAFLVVPAGLLSLSVATRQTEWACHAGVDPNWRPRPDCPKIGVLALLCQWIYSENDFAAAMGAADPAVLGQWHARMAASDLESVLDDAQGLLAKPSPSRRL